MNKPLQITFPRGSIANLLYAESNSQLPALLRQLGLQSGQPVMVVIGGASKLSGEDVERVKRIFSEVLVPLAMKWGAFVVDGGTDAGIMRLMGHARKQLGASFPLVGVVPIGLAILPEDGYVVSEEDAAPLEPNHTHFLLVPGSEWGDESPWIASVASSLAVNQPSVTILINGGEITWQDASESATQGRETIVIAGSGRTADALAAAVRGESSVDQRARSLVETGLFQAIDLNASREELTQAIEEIFTDNGMI